MIIRADEMEDRCIYELWETKKELQKEMIDRMNITPGFYQSSEKLMEKINTKLGVEAKFTLVSVGNEKYF